MLIAEGKELSAHNYGRLFFSCLLMLCIILRVKTVTQMWQRVCLAYFCKNRKVI